jgi:excisionase family DNA binding protein
MAEEKLLTVREVSIILNITEREVIELAESGAIPAYKVGGVFLRFKKEQVFEYQKKNQLPFSKSEGAEKYRLRDKISDFFYFNDFYILTFLIVLLLLAIIFQGYQG